MREVVRYYAFIENCFVLKQIAICSEITESYSMYWVILHEYACDDFDTFKENCLSIVEKEIPPVIQSCMENRLPIIFE